MKIITAITLILLLSYTVLPIQKNNATNNKEPNYEEIIKEKYKEVETSKKLNKSWTEGILTEYDLTLDHMKINYTVTDIVKTTDKKTLVCGNLLLIAYAKTSDGSKMRVVSSRAICHLFNKEKIEKVLVINKETNKVLNGWDNSVITLNIRRRE